LIVATSLVQADPAVCDYLIAILEADGRATLALAEERCADLGRIVFEAEIQVARGGLGQVRDLALDSEASEPLLEQGLDLAVELADCDRACDSIRLARIFHARQYN